MITIINLLADAALKLIPVSDSPRLDAEVLLVPKLLLGNGVFEAPASRRTTEQEPAK